jgi:hypothetical protein
MKKSVLSLLMFCMSLCSYSQSYWYYGTVEDLNNGSAPIPEKAIAYTNADYQTYDATESAWYKLDTSVAKLRIPYAIGNITSEILCIAVPTSSGINDITDADGDTMINDNVSQSKKTINGIGYIVWTSFNHGRLMGYLINSNPTAIKGVKTTQANGGATYNLASQKVSTSYKGVVIKDGKKYLQK